MYFKWDEKTLDISAPDFQSQLAEHYRRGYILGRVEPGYVWQTRSLRLDLKTFRPNSENRRVLKKFTDFPLQFLDIQLPINPEGYSWKIHSMGKHYYSTKFPGEKFSASKIKAMLTTPFVFNRLLVYHNASTINSYSHDSDLQKLFEQARGYNIGYLGDNFFHYCFPFYDLNQDTSNLGMYMMLHAILWAQLLGLDYIYLGSVTRPADKYKLQFNGLEWFDGNEWKTDLLALKDSLISATD